MSEKPEQGWPEPPERSRPASGPEPASQPEISLSALLEEIKQLKQQLEQEKAQSHDLLAQIQKASSDALNQVSNPSADEADEQALVKEPHFREITQSYRGTKAEWLLARIIGWHERLSEDRQKDIDHILYLLKAARYIPEDAETAPFIALIALIWARLPLAPDLNEDPPATRKDVFEQVKLAAKELELIGKKEFLKFDSELDKFRDETVVPRLEKFGSITSGLSKKLDEAMEKLEKLESIEKSIKKLDEAPAARLELDNGKIAREIAEQVVSAGKQQFKGIYLWMAGVVAALAFLMGGILAPVVQHLLR